MRIGQVIQERRKQLRIKQIELASLAGITPSYLSLIESGKRVPEISILQKLSENLSFSLAVLLLLSTESNDVAPDKRQLFDETKPLIDNIIQKLISDDLIAK